MGYSNVRTAALPSSSQVIDATDMKNAVVYYGFTVKNTHTAASHVRFRAGSSTGAILDTVQLTVDESRAEAYLPQGIYADDSIFFEIVDGTVEGTVRYG